MFPGGCSAIARKQGMVDEIPTWQTYAVAEAARNFCGEADKAEKRRILDDH